MTRLAPTPTPPLMLYDGDCGFCQRWIDRWRAATGPRVRYEPFQTALTRFPQLSREQCQTAVQLVLPDGRITSGAAAVFTALAHASRYRSLLWLYQHIPLFGRAAEIIYQLIAQHRSLFSAFAAAKTCGLPPPAAALKDPASGESGGASNPPP